ncbi:MAG: right-handed parallel beta-helix repeat-containing protein [Candidatus Zixiibacteriota bacterium]
MSRICKLLVLVIFATSLITMSWATEIHVPIDFETIQEAIDNSTAGDTIRVCGGKYYEYIDINKQLTLIGDGSAITSIIGSDSGDVVKITANGVNFKGFSVTGSGDLSAVNEYWDAGLHIKYVDSCSIENCLFANNLGSGLALHDGYYNAISKCIFKDNHIGLNFHSIDSTGWPWKSNLYNQITGNIFLNNEDFGIAFLHGMDYHRYNEIHTNIFRNCGIYMILSGSNNVSYNEIINYEGYAIYKEVCDGGGSYNSFHRNYFLNENGDSSLAFNLIEEGGYDNWYYNYWLDYTGVDEDEDGYGEECYMLDSWDWQYAYDCMPKMAMPDIDADSIADTLDNCRDMANTDQTDVDQDWVGDACDDCIDSDYDGYGDLNQPQNSCPVDNCPFVYNPDQIDDNGDGIGDACWLPCGDMNKSWTVNILDVTYLIAYLYKSGPEPLMMQSADVNKDMVINILDITKIIGFLYKGNDPLICHFAWPVE